MPSSEKCTHDASSPSSMLPMIDSSTLPDYEVFQAEVAKHKANETTKENTDESNCDASPSNFVINKRIGMAVSLHDELRFAIINKASEHRKREAAALGITEDEVESLYLTRDVDARSSDILANSRASRQQEMNAMRIEMANVQRELMKSQENDLSASRAANIFHPSHIHASLLAATSSISQSEEHFGDSNE